VKVLLVEDEAHVAASLKIGLRAEGFVVVHAETGTEGLWQASENYFDVIILDIMLPGPSGYEILRQIRRERHGLPGYSVLVNAHPAVVDVMQGEERAAVAEAEKRYMRRIEFNPRTEYHIEQFDLHGK